MDIDPRSRTPAPGADPWETSRDDEPTENLDRPDPAGRRDRERPSLGTTDGRLPWYPLLVGLAGIVYRFAVGVERGEVSLTMVVLFGILWLGTWLVAGDLLYRWTEH